MSVNLVEQQFSTPVPWNTNVPQEFLKHAVPDYFSQGQ